MKYSIEGEPLPVVICELENGESLQSESGAMSWMSPNMLMETTSGGGIGKVFGRAFSGETLFLNRYTAQGGPGMIAFSACFPGTIKSFEITPDKPIIAQKHSFLAATGDVDLSIFFQKKFSGGLFGGEGFIMQQISGNGMAFLEFDGYVKKYTLNPGQQMVIDTGYLAAMSATCSLEVKSIKGVKNVLFGGEGLFNTVVTGPGDIWIQGMPVMKLAYTLLPYLPYNS